MSKSKRSGPGAKQHRPKVPTVSVRHNPAMVDAVREMFTDGPGPNTDSPDRGLIDASMLPAVDKILRAAGGLNGSGEVDMDRVDELIAQHPGVAVEGLAKLGRVIQIPRDKRVPEVAVHFDPMEIKARVVSDLHKGRIIPSARMSNKLSRDLTLASVLAESTPVNVQAIFDRWMVAGKGNDIYDMQLAPPWNNALLVYNNDHGNVWAMHAIASDIQRDPAFAEHRHEVEWQPSRPADHEIEWDRVRWIISVQVYIGGQWMDTSASDEVRRTPTFGPLMIWRLAVYEDGVPADIHWTQISESVSMYKFNNALGVLTETINMCNCVNVHIAVPQRKMTRPQRRRMERTGVTFSEVHIRPASKSYKSIGVPLSEMDVPLHGVIGHYNEYGPKYGKGLLFGKLAGRFWIPPHVRGTREAGEVIQSYITDSPVVSTASDLATGAAEEQ